MTKVIRPRYNRKHPKDSKIKKSIPRENKLLCCDRCGKAIDDFRTIAISKKNGEKYCQSCLDAINEEIANLHMICSSCGIDMPIENMHVIDDALICHSCFLKKYVDIDFLDE